MRQWSVLIIAMALATLLAAPACKSKQAGNGGTGEGVDTSGELPAGWPDDVPIMRGFTIKTTETYPDTESESDAFIVWASGHVSVDEAGEFYSSLPGWEIQSGRLDDRELFTPEERREGVMIQGTNGSRHILAMVTIVQEEDTEYLEQGMRLGETVLCITHVTEPPAD